MKETNYSTINMTNVWIEENVILNITEKNELKVGE